MKRSSSRSGQGSRSSIGLTGSAFTTACRQSTAANQSGQQRSQVSFLQLTRSENIRHAGSSPRAVWHNGWAYLPALHIPAHQLPRVLKHAPVLALLL